MFFSLFSLPQLGSVYAHKYSVQHNLIAYQNNTMVGAQSLPVSSLNVRVKQMEGNF